MKAFDSISHRSLWDALGHCVIEPQYLSLFKRLYERQKRSVLTDKESDVFETEKGTKQGDPLSRSLLNTVLRVALKDDLAKWQRKARAFGFEMSDSDCRTNLRLADDVVLYATSLEQLQSMLCDFKRSTEKAGLKIHPERRRSSATKVRAKSKK